MSAERGEASWAALGTTLRRIAGLGLIADGTRALRIGHSLVLGLLVPKTTGQSPGRVATGTLAGAAEVIGGLALLEATPLAVPQLYHFFARFYDPTSRLWRHFLFPDVQAAFDRALRAYLPADGAILDLGCGTGANLARLRALDLPFGSYVGIDLTPEMLAVAEKKLGHLPNVRFQQVNLLTDPLPDGPFDVIVSTWVFSHLPDPEVVVAKALRRLRPGGRAIFLFLADPGGWVSPLEDLLLRPFSARAVPEEAYRQFPDLSDVQAFAGDTIAMAVLKAATRSSAF